MTRDEYNRKYAYLGAGITRFDTATYKDDQRYRDLMATLEDNTEVTAVDTRPDLSFITFAKWIMYLGIAVKIIEVLG